MMGHGFPVFAWRYMATPLVVAYRGQMGLEWKALYVFGFCIMAWRINT